MIPLRKKCRRRIAKNYTKNAYLRAMKFTSPDKFGMRISKVEHNCIQCERIIPANIHIWARELVDEIKSGKYPHNKTGVRDYYYAIYFCSLECVENFIRNNLANGPLTAEWLNTHNPRCKCKCV